MAMYAVATTGLPCRVEVLTQLFGHSMSFVGRDYVYAHFVAVFTLCMKDVVKPKHFTVHVYGFGQHRCAKVVL